METLARRFAKTIVVLWIFLISIRFIYQPLSYILLWNQNYLIMVCDYLGISGVEDIDTFDAFFSLTVSAIMTAAFYFVLLKLYRSIRAHR